MSLPLGSKEVNSSLLIDPNALLPDTTRRRNLIDRCVRCGSVDGLRVSDPDERTAARFFRARKEDLEAAVQQYIEAERFYAAWSCDEIAGPALMEHVFRATCTHANLPMIFDRNGQSLPNQHTPATSTELPARTRVLSCSLLLFRPLPNSLSIILLAIRGFRPTSLHRADR